MPQNVIVAASLCEILILILFFFKLFFKIIFGFRAGGGTEKKYDEYSNYFLVFYRANN